MPSPRVLAVTALAALGGLAGLFSAGDGGVPASTDAQSVRGGLVSQASGAVAAENAKTGTRTWRIGTTRAAAQGLTAYAGATSAAPGEKVSLFLRGNGATHARAYRLGWYGGAGARQVWESTFPATAQTGTAANWTSTSSIDTTGWPEGTYLIRLDLGGASRYVPLTVTSARSGAAGRVVVLTSPMTWAATGRKSSVGKGRTVTLDRPLVTGDGGGGLVADAGLIAQIERTGTDVVYLTDADLAAAPGLIDGATALLVDGDSRYWTAQMRTSVRKAVDAGTNLAFFGAGSAEVNVVRNSTAPRTFTVAAAATAASSQLTGSVATCRANWATALTVADPTWWGFEGGSVRNGEVLRRLVSGRLDRVAVPSDASVAASADLACGQTQATTYREKPSGAGVFTAGTQAWACTVSGACTDATGRRIKADARAQQVAALVTRNVVKAFATPKAAPNLP
ncbi:N,N-dimethylformamidase beta subunit family domain-containing protein [Kineosporia sp. NBRC 101731]|uniref:N,N-dimethylformamidase beta subunit family domain-containing protein n=1 Tax=Kineosporia sp. NBRC 101731 TaxID=3032199 RepID=UPI0024A239EF|nr:N,N-dimethylformamidase beta subunit family domain-containing protein [Kineosporia sp. NBRC 101731]GLY31232.1 hypothetical protein Kisp02_45970 [Kineosporia sp. NBRC 101731]